MKSLTKIALATSLLFAAAAAAAAPVTQSIGPLNYDHYSWQGWSDDNFGQIDLAKGTNMITSISGSSTTFDQGWGGYAACCNAVNLTLYAGTTLLWSDHFAGGERNDGWEYFDAIQQDYAISADQLDALNGVLAGIDWASSPDLSLQLHGNAWAYPGWELHVQNASLTVESDVPEPTTLALLGLGAFGILAGRRKAKA